MSTYELAIEGNASGATRAFEQSKAAATRFDDAVRQLTQGTYGFNQATKRFITESGSFAKNLDVLNSIGIKTTQQIEQEIEALDRLAAAYRHDANVSAQLANRKQQLANSIGGLAAGNKQAAYVAQNFSYVLQDLPYGIRGVANNVDQLIYSYGQLRQQAATLTAQTGKQVTAFSLLKSSLSGPMGVLIGINLLTSAWMLYNDKIKGMISPNMSNLADETKRLKEELEGVAGAILSIQNKTPVFKIEDVETAKELAAYYKQQADEAERLSKARTTNLTSTAFYMAQYGGFPEVTYTLGSEARRQAIQDAKDYRALLAETEKQIKRIEAEQRLANKTRESGLDLIEETNNSTKEQLSLLAQLREKHRELVSSLSEARSIEGERIGVLEYQNLRLEEQLNIVKRINLERARQDALMGQYGARATPSRMGTMGVEEMAGSGSYVTKYHKWGRRAGGGLEMSEAVVIGRLRDLSARTGEALERINEGLDEQLFEGLDRFNQAAGQLTETLQMGLVDGIYSLGSAMGEFGLSAQGFSAAGNMVLGTLADMAISTGKIAIGTGLAIEGIKDALASLNPAVAIGAGIALVALGSYVKGQLKGVANTANSRPSYGSAGAYGYPTMSSSPDPFSSPSKFTAPMLSRNAYDSTMKIEIVGKTTGRDMVWTLKNETQAMKAMGIRNPLG